MNTTQMLNNKEESLQLGDKFGRNLPAFFSGIVFPVLCVALLGVPEAELSWFRNKVKLGPDHYLHDGSLLLANISLSDQGLYSCRAANIRGEVTESTQLLVL
ncbi:hypothetical protein lerEdw1_000081, partial [Lerista edwardsae]